MAILENNLERSVCRRNGSGGVIYGGLMRGFLDMSLGVLSYKMVGLFRRWSSLMIGVIEVMCMAYSGYIMTKGFCVENYWFYSQF